MICEWCGHAHDVRSLCTKRPTWGRRGFLSMVGATLVGTALDPMGFLKAPPASPWSKMLAWTVKYRTLGNGNVELYLAS